MVSNHVYVYLHEQHALSVRKPEKAENDAALTKDVYESPPWVLFSGLDVKSKYFICFL